MDKTPLKAHIKAAFSKASKTYGQASSVQKELGAMLLNKVIHIGFPDNAMILDIGCGDGALSERLIKALSPKAVVLLDFSGPMLKRARERLQGLDTAVTFLEADMEDALPDAIYGRSFNLVFSNSTLQWAWDLHGLVNKIQGVMAEESLFAASIFTKGTLFELDQCLRHLGLDGTQSSRFKGSSEVVEILEKEFIPLISQRIKLVRSYENALGLLRSLKLSGVNPRTRLRRGLLKWELRSLDTCLKKGQSDAGNLVVTFEAVLFVGVRKKALDQPLTSRA